MTSPTLADLRYAFYGSGPGRSVTDNEYIQLKALYDQGITLQNIGSARLRERNLRVATPNTWTEKVFSLDDAVCPTSTLTFEHGQAVLRGSGAGAGSRSGRRSAFLIPNSPVGYSRIRSRWAGKPEAVGFNPQHGHAHGLGTQADGKRRAVIFWHDIIFAAPWVFNLGIWESNTDGTSFALPSGGLMYDQAAFTGGSRTTNVVTLTGLPSGHGFVKGDVITIGASDAGYNGTFVVSSVTDTTVVYGHTAADDASSGTGTVALAKHSVTKSALIRQVAISDAARTSGLVTATIPAGHPFTLGDAVSCDTTDATYDGIFYITEVTATTVKWRQAVADDASSGAGTLTKVLPYFAESIWTGNQLIARVWPDVGVGVSQASGVGVGVMSGPLPGGPPAWGSQYAMTMNLSGAGAAIPDPARGEGCGIILGHPASGSLITECRYDSIEAEAVTAA